MPPVRRSALPALPFTASTKSALCAEAKAREASLTPGKAAALRSRTVGSQDESRYCAIHKPPHSKLGQACDIASSEVPSRQAAERASAIPARQQLIQRIHNAESQS